MIQILGDLIADISMRLPHFPVQAKDIHRLSYMEVGPGGACNVAIMAARYGLEVGALGEVGDDGFGLVVREGLKREGVDVEQLIVSEGAATPVAGVVVDQQGEPAYLGHPGSLRITEFQDAWAQAIRGSRVLFADGWAEHPAVPPIILRGFEIAREAGATTYFDPGPGNPDIDPGWVPDAIERSQVLLLNRSEARRITGKESEEEIVSHLLDMGPETLVLKRGSEGLLLAQGGERLLVDAYPVEARDATGAGDSLAGAVLFGMQRGLGLEKLGQLANATGAAKVRKLGTGHNMPTMEEIAEVLEDAGLVPKDFLP